MSAFVQIRKKVHWSDTDAAVSGLPDLAARQARGAVEMPWT